MQEIPPMGRREREQESWRPRTTAALTSSGQFPCHMAITDLKKKESWWPKTTAALTSRVCSLIHRASSRWLQDLQRSVCRLKNARNTEWRLKCCYQPSSLTIWYFCTHESDRGKIQDEKRRWQEDNKRVSIYIRPIGNTGTGRPSTAKETAILPNVFLYGTVGQSVSQWLCFFNRTRPD